MRIGKVITKAVIHAAGRETNVRSKQISGAYSEVVSMICDLVGQLHQAPTPEMEAIFHALPRVVTLPPVLQ